MEIESNTPPNPASQPTEEAAKLREELLRERFEAVAVKHGLDDQFVDLVAPQAHRWLEQHKREATREALAEYMQELRTAKPKLFAPAQAPVSATPAAPANTAPVMASPAPAIPAPAALETPFTKWRALLAAGRRAEAEAFYRVNRRAIARS